MKKIACYIILSLFSYLCLQAQNPNDVVIDGTYKGNRIYVKGTRTPSGTMVKKLEYKPLNALEQEVENLKKQKNQLEKQKNQLVAENERLKKNKPDKTTNNKAVTDSLEQVTKRLVQKEEQAKALRAEIENLRKEIQSTQALNESNINELQEKIQGLQLQIKRKGINTDFIEAGMEIGISRLYNDIIKQSDFWYQPANIQLQGFQATYTHYFQRDIPIAIKVGLGISMNGIRASFIGNGDTIENLKDDGDSLTFDARYSYKNVQEDINLTYVNVPLLIHFGNSFNTHGIQPWCNLGVMMSFKIGEKNNIHGTYTKYGYYKFGDGFAIIENVEELGFESNVDLSERKDIPTDANNIVIWGVAAAGINIPINDKIGIGVSARCAYSITPVSEYQNKWEKHCLLPEHSTLLADKTRLFSTGLDFTITYNF